jgi:glycosyltransferase involved in cell wall biosynthesis
MPPPLVSVLINNYNYDRYVANAIESALEQDYSNFEIIVVDDGSTDRSRDVILSYDGKITPIFKKNGGQASAFNVGVAASRGDVLCFLDADDFFFPDKLASVVEVFNRQGLNLKPLMVHHLLEIQSDEMIPSGMDAVTGTIHESPRNLYDFARRHRFVWYEIGPTTSISINRRLANTLFPIPEHGVRLSADDFVVFGAWLLSDVYSLDRALGRYRVHGGNYWFYADRRKSAEFLATLENYLNDKLTHNGLSPVIDFNNSIYAWSGFVADKRWLKLAIHMLKLLILDHDRYTALFVYHTLMQIGMQSKRATRARLLMLKKAIRRMTHLVA